MSSIVKLIKRLLRMMMGRKCCECGSTRELIQCTTHTYVCRTCAGFMDYTEYQPYLYP